MRHLRIVDVLQMNREQDQVMTMQQRGPQLTAEQAKSILSSGKAKIAGTEVHVFSNRLSELPLIEIGQVLGSDVFIDNVKGTVDAGKFGPSFVVELGNRPKLPTHSMFINQTSVMGKQLQKLIDSKSFPAWVNIHSGESVNGQTYYTFDVPAVLTQFQNDGAAAPAANGAEDLPW